MHRQNIFWGIFILAAFAASVYLASRIYFASSLDAPNQVIDESIRLSFRLGSPKGGFVAIFKVETGNEGDWLQVILTERLAPDLYTNMAIPIPDDAEASGSALIGSTLMAYLIEDSNKNGLWDATDKKLDQKIFQDIRLPLQDGL